MYYMKSSASEYWKQKQEISMEKEKEKKDELEERSEWEINIKKNEMNSSDKQWESSDSVHTY